MRMHVKYPIHKKYTINVSPRAKVKLTEERLGQYQMRVKTRKKDKTKLLSRQSFTAGVSGMAYGLGQVTLQFIV